MFSKGCQLTDFSRRGGRRPTSRDGAALPHAGTSPGIKSGREGGISHMVDPDEDPRPGGGVHLSHDMPDVLLYRWQGNPQRG